MSLYSQAQGMLPGLGAYLKRLIKVHQLVQSQGPIIGIVHCYSPISPMAIRISHKIVYDIHHIVVMLIQAYDILLCILIMILAVNFKGFRGYDGIFL